MEPTSRENFLREVQPNIVQSLGDRYTIINGKNVYERRYDTLLLLTPEVSVEYMMTKNNLPDCFEEWAHVEVLTMKSSDIVVKKRELYSQKLYPFDQSDLKKYKAELLLKKGDLMVINFPERMFGQGIECNDPDYPKALGTKVEGTSHYCNLYKIGAIFLSGGI